MTTNLRGLLLTQMRVTTLREGLHSGDASGICSDSFRIIRLLLSRIENEANGRVVDAFQVSVPDGRLKEIRALCDLLGDAIWNKYPLINGVPMDSKKDSFELALNRTWRATLTVTGQDGLPSCATGGNVVRPSTNMKLSMRLPPTYDHSKAMSRFEGLIRKDAPADCQIEFHGTITAPGWNAPEMDSWLTDSVTTASKGVFNRAPAFVGEGGSIPFMGMLGDLFPRAQFVVTGVLGPGSNAHGPNEFLDIEYCKKVISCVSHILADHCVRVISPQVKTSANDSLSNDRVQAASEDKLVSEKLRLNECC